MRKTRNTSLSYNSAINRITRLFDSLEHRKQIPMAERYAERLINKTVQCCGKDYWVKETMQRILSRVLDDNIARLMWKHATESAEQRI